MKFNLKIFSPIHIINSLREICVRFPLSVIISVQLTFVLIYINHNHLIIPIENLKTLSLTLVSSFFLATGLYIFSESKKYNYLKSHFFQILTIIFGIGFYFYFENNFSFQNISFFIIITFGIISFLFIAPFFSEVFKKQESESKYPAYIEKMFFVILSSFFIGIVITLLSNIIIFTLKVLFDIETTSTTPIDILIFSSALIAPFYGLSQLPKKDFLESNTTIGAFSKIFTSFIAVPFIIIFGILLYAYFVKILLNFSDFPKGEVAWLVLAFSSFSYLTYILIRTSKTEDNLSTKFKNIIPILVIPQIFMLFYSIYVRISYYGITINRYLACVIGLGFLISSIYFIISKRKFLGFLPFMISVICILISFGPWSVYNVSLKNQTYLLEKQLRKANILSKNGEITKGDRKVNSNLKNSIESKMSYVCQFNECQTLKNLFPEFYKKLEEESKKKFERRKQEKIATYKNKIEKAKKENNKHVIKKYKNLLEYEQTLIYKGPGKWEIINGISDKLDLYSDEWELKNGSNLINIEFKRNNTIDIKGFNTFISLTDFGKNDYINLADNSIILSDKNIVLPFNLKEEILKQLEESRKENPIIINFEVKNIPYKLLIYDIHMQKNNTSEKYYENIEGVLLVGENKKVR